MDSSKQLRTNQSRNRLINPNLNADANFIPLEPVAAQSWDQIILTDSRVLRCKVNAVLWI